MYPGSIMKRALSEPGNTALFVSGLEDVAHLEGVHQYVNLPVISNRIRLNTISTTSSPFVELGHIPPATSLNNRTRALSSCELKTVLGFSCFCF